jgi:uncharacterized protein YgbK (DUF1537 family)
MDVTTLADLTAGFPEVPAITAEDVGQAIERAVHTPFFVVLDDDPTGTQSVSDLPVLAAWEPADFAWALGTGAGACYVMLNSRSLDPDAARQVNRQAVRAAMTAAHEAGVEVAFVSRSDSTLRGHYPLEPDTIAEELEAQGQAVDGVVIVPAFPAAGRITVGGVHYAGSAERGFVPVGQSEFARDATFGYAASSLAEWVAEKTDGRFPVDSVVSVDLALLRTDRAAVVALLRSARDRRPIVCDAVCEEDLRALALAVIEAESQGSRFVYRVGPTFVRARLGIDIPAVLDADRIAASRAGDPPAAGGLIVVGSHTGLTSGQLARLEAEQRPARFEIDVAEVLGAGRDAHIAKVSADVIRALGSGNVVIATSRELVKGADAADSLAIARRVSAAVVTVVQQVVAGIRPRFVISKGGITSSDVAALGLAMRHGWVAGPMLPGLVSLLSAQDGPARGVPFAIFPGNVGDESSLALVAAKLSAPADPR